MDYTPPPELESQYVFANEVKKHFWWRGFMGNFAPVFGRRDLSSLSDQAEAQSDVCLRQLKETGQCEIKGLTARNGDKVTTRFDKSCAIAVREGKVNGMTVSLIPAEIGRLLPKPDKPVPALDCSKPGVMHAPAPAASSPVSYWHEVAGRPVALAPAVPRLALLRRSELALSRRPEIV